MSTISVKELYKDYKSIMLVYPSELEDFIKDGWKVIDMMTGESTGFIVYVLGYKKGTKAPQFSTKSMELIVEAEAEKNQNQ